MINPIASEALYSATYVDNYIDSVENLPDDIQRQLSRIRDIDVTYRNLLRDVDHYYDLWRSLQNSGDNTANRRERTMKRMQQCLIQAQELGDEKMKVVYQLQELIDHKMRQLDIDQKNLNLQEDIIQRDHQMVDEFGPSQQKQLRIRSPDRMDHLLSNVNGAVGLENSVDRYNTVKDHSNNSFSGGGGSSTPNSERSGSVAVGGATNGNASNANLVLSDVSRTMKRSRRRNDNSINVSGNMDLLCNESNSATEGVSNGGGVHERGAIGIQKNLNTGTQKKNSSQSQSGIGNATAASGAGNNSVNTTNNTTTGKKKKRKARGSQSAAAQATNAREDTPTQDAIDPDEPTYCVCNQISFGEMILCDNDLCPIEWFHFSCVSLVLKPKGKWYCPNCRGDRPNVMKPKAQFLKELERYNKEKEEKT